MRPDESDLNPEDKNLGSCIGCGQKARYTIQLAVGPDGDSDDARYYLPNDFTRQSGVDVLHEVPFCRSCMRHAEDNFRATIRYLQHENRETPLSIYEYGFSRGKI
jgi:hypothetical protein